MKVIIALFALVAVAVAAPQSNTDDADAKVLKYENDNIGLDNFNVAFETSNGIVQEVQGHLINAGTENEAIAVRGSFKYIGADGVTYQVTYVADENGFQPQGEHLPVARQ